MSKKGEPREPSWTESEIRFLRENYIQVPVAEIAAQLGRSYESVRRKASKVGAQRQVWGKKFTPADDDLLRERYATSSMAEMTALLGHHHNSIRQRARALGLVNAEQVKRARMASAIRHDYFGQIDAPLKAYLLGLLATDGKIGYAHNGVGLKVGLKDVELPELLRNEIAPHSSVRTYTQPPLPGYTKERKVADFSVCSAQMKADLGALGVVPRKTFILTWPALEPQFVAPFILGCFDGDGTLQWRGRPWTWRWEIYSASEPFLRAVQDAILQHTGLSLIWNLNKGKLPALRLNGGRSIQVLDAWLHADVPGLSRKRLPQGAYARAREEAVAQRAERDRKRSLAGGGPEKLERTRQLRARGLSLDEVAAEVGISRSTVYRWTRQPTSKGPVRAAAGVPAPAPVPAP